MSKLAAVPRPSANPASSVSERKLILNELVPEVPLPAILVIEPDGVIFCTARS